MTAGWPVNAGSLATKPTTFTMREIESREPVTDRTAASALSAQVRA